MSSVRISKPRWLKQPFLRLRERLFARGDAAQAAPAGLVPSGSGALR